ELKVIENASKVGKAFVFSLFDKKITLVEFDEEMTTSAKSDKEEIQIFAESNIEEISKILGVEISGVEEMSEVEISD
ncbi:23412_t:CDS:2, partial [Gigaspora rosea]